jgi:Uma2 family endonuclease
MVAKPIVEIPIVLLEAMWVDGEQETSPLVLDFRPVLELMARLEYSERDVDRWLIEFNHANSDLVGKLELDAEGALLITPMLREAGSSDEMVTLVSLANWAEDYGGDVHGSRLGIRMPNGQRYAPDAAWISPEQQAYRPEPYPAPEDWLLPFCPAFVVEIRSRSDRLAALQRKMADYIANGALLAWLIDPYQRQVHIYRPGVAPLVLDDPEVVSGEPELTGFVFEVRRRIFDRESEPR